MATDIKIIKTFTENPNWEAVNLGSLTDKAATLLAVMCRCECAYHHTDQNLIHMVCPTFFWNANHELMATGLSNWRLPHFGERKNVKGIGEITKHFKEHLAIHLKLFWLKMCRSFALKDPEQAKLYLNFSGNYFSDCVQTKPSDGFTEYSFLDYRFLYETLLGRKSALNSGKYPQEIVSKMTCTSQGDSFTTSAINTIMNEIKRLEGEREQKLEALRTEKDRKYNEFYKILTENFRHDVDQTRNEFDAKIDELKKQVNALAGMA